MRLIELKCTNCGGKLVKKGFLTYECPYCSAAYLLGKVQTKKETPQIMITKEQVQILGVFALALVGIFAIMLGWKALSVNSLKPEGQWQETTAPTSVPGSSEGMTWQEAIDAGVVVIVEPKEGEGFQVFVEKVFGKEYDWVTQSEWESVTDIRFSSWGDYQEITCVVNGETKTFFYEGSAQYILPYIHGFANLETLYVYNSVEGVKFEALPRLTHLRCNNSITQLAGIHPHPEQLVYLAGVDVDDDFTGVEKFQNLRTLEIDANDLLDLSALGSLENLENITIDAYEAKNFEFLSQLTKLKSVYIDAGNMYTIVFAENLKNLEELNIERSEVTSLAPIANNTKLKYLNINACSDITDVEVINTLTGLESLAVSGDNIESKIEWGNLKNLKALSLSAPWRTNFMDSVEALQGLETLYLSWCNMSLDRLAELKNLKHLTLAESDVSVFVLKELTSLETLKLTKMSDIQGAEGVFSLPKVQEVTFFDCDLIMDFEKIPACDSLKKLEIQYCYFDDIIIEEEKDFYYYEDYEDVELRDKLAFLSGFPNLKELTIRGGKLENVAFAEYLPFLERLDVTNNYISDVSSLNQCKSLTFLSCGDNALLDKPTFDWEVMVDMQGENNIFYD
ncbi:MAG: hypothetical protein IJ379_08640 [Lachnospiraceae bacterium]|nr:hypothetical protein [Lachnospiraceae bacterium]